LCVLSLLCRYHLHDVVVGKIYFLLVSLKIIHMEVQLLKNEVITGQCCFIFLFFFCSLFCFSCVILCFQYMYLVIILISKCNIFCFALRCIMIILIIGENC